MDHVQKLILRALCLFIAIGVFPYAVLAEERSDTDNVRRYYLKDTLDIRTAYQLDKQGEQQINDRRILIKVQEGKDFSIESFGVDLIKVNDIMVTHDYVLVQVPEVANFNEKLAIIRAHSDVVMAEPDYIRESAQNEASFAYDKQWYLSRIDMPKAWAIESIKPSTEAVKIAVLDSGVNANHPNLRGRVLPGYNFVHNNVNTADDHGHGTFVSGIIAANSSSKELAGIDGQVSILPIKASNRSGDFYLTNIVAGIHYAIDNGADVINMSFGADKPSIIEEEAIWSAHEAGIVLVASAGNEGSYKHVYPASYAPVISVAATNQEDRRATFSNYGERIDITAPGTYIYNTNYLGGYIYKSGTSFSAPIISGLASLLKAQHPDWTNDQIEWALEAGADSLGRSEWNKYDGYGRANAYGALTLELPLWEDNAPNKRNLAEKLHFNEVVSEKIDYPMDEDWFRIDVEEDAVITIDIKNPSETLDLVAILSDASNQNHFIDEGGIGKDESYTFKAKRGAYFIGLYDYYNHWSTVPYEIEVTSYIVKYPDVVLYNEEINALTERGIIKGYPDGNFKPKLNVTRLQAVQMILNEMGVDLAKADTVDPKFVDIHPDTYGYEAIAKAVELGFIKGKSDGSFAPNEELTRWQMAAILVAAYDLKGAYKDTFSDVPKGHFAYDVVHTLAANNITKGYADQTFRPNGKVSREHFSVFLYNYLYQ